MPFIRAGGAKSKQVSKVTPGLLLIIDLKNELARPERPGLKGHESIAQALARL
jgi:hypothetical protein